MVEKDLKGKKENAGNLDMRAEILKEGGGGLGLWGSTGATHTAGTCATKIIFL